jgi:hypothetical protein
MSREEYIELIKEALYESGVDSYYNRQGSCVNKEYVAITIANKLNL